MRWVGTFGGLVGLLAMCLCGDASADGGTALECGPLNVPATSDGPGIGCSESTPEREDEVVQPGCVAFFGEGSMQIARASALRRSADPLDIRPRPICRPPGVLQGDDPGLSSRFFAASFFE